jgi:hypothetical protein
VRAIEQAHAETRLEAAQLVTDGAVGDAERGPRATEMQVARRHLESAQGLQGEGSAVEHRGSL